MPEIQVPLPQKPLPVAQQFARAEYGDPRARRLVHHRGVFYHWLGPCWEELDRRGIRAALYHWLGEADYINKDGGPPSAADASPSEPSDVVAHPRTWGWA